MSEVIAIERRATAIPLALDGGLRQPKTENCYILVVWEHVNQKTDTSTWKLTKTIFII